MKTVSLFVLLFVSFIELQGQSIRKYSISNSGCTVYLFCDPKKWDIDYSEDSSKVCTAECINDQVTYGVICIQLLNAVDDLDAAESMMISYLDYLKASFNILSAAGYGKGHILNNDEQTKGVIDYWQDKDSNHWKIKAWTNGKFIGVLYANSKNEIPETKVNLFLDGFRFPVK